MSFLFYSHELCAPWTRVTSAQSPSDDVQEDRLSYCSRINLSRRMRIISTGSIAYNRVD